MSDASALLRLQQIDLELLRLRRVVEALPQRERILAARTALKKVAGELTKIVGQRKDLEIEIDDLESTKRDVHRLVDEAQQRSQESGYRDVRDLEGQLSVYAKRLERAEFDADRAVERLEVVERAERNALALKAKLEAQEASQLEEMRKQSADIAGQVKDLTTERESVVAELPAQLVSRYDRAVKRFGGVAVETLDGNKPSACRVALQPSSFADIRNSGEDIVTCPYCKRILVLGEAGSR